MILRDVEARRRKAMEVCLTIILIRCKHHSRILVCVRVHLNLLLL